MNARNGSKMFKPLKIKTARPAAEEKKSGGAVVETLATITLPALAPGGSVFWSWGKCYGTSSRIPFGSVERRSILQLIPNGSNTNLF